MVTNSLCIHHARKESRHCKKERKIYIYIYSRRQRSGITAEITNYLNSAGSRAWKTNDARGKGRFSISWQWYTPTFVRASSEAGLFACRSTDLSLVAKHVTEFRRLRLSNFNQTIVTKRIVTNAYEIIHYVHYFFHRNIQFIPIYEQ